jgi:hypothetical protein
LGILSKTGKQINISELVIAGQGKPYPAALLCALALNDLRYFRKEFFFCGTNGEFAVQESVNFAFQFRVTAKTAAYATCGVIFNFDLAF